MAKKVLIVYATGGMGHVSAAKAIAEAFQKNFSEVEIKNVDILDFGNSWFRVVFVDGYNYISAKFPKMWGWLYRRYNDKSRQDLPTTIAYKLISKRFISYIENFKPDFIISTHPLPMLLASRSKARHIISITSSMVVTDFGCHSFWVDPQVNYYFTATPEVGMCLQNHGARPEQIIVTGIPIQSKFAKIHQREELLKKFSLRLDVSTVLIVGGQFAYETLERILRGIESVHGKNVQFIIVAGRDKSLKEALEKSNLDTNNHIKVFGFVDNMDELMTVSDIIFSKAGGLTVSECMAKGLPMVINRVIPGQEEDNVVYLSSKGAAVHVDSAGGIIQAVNDLIGNPEKIKAMKKSAQAIGRPNSAYDLAKFVYEKIKQ